MEVDILVEEKVVKISEEIKVFQAKIVDLEAKSAPSTPPKLIKEREQRLTMTTIVENNNTLQEKCRKLCEERTWVWTKLLEDNDLQKIEKKI